MKTPKNEMEKCIKKVDQKASKKVLKKVKKETNNATKKANKNAEKRDRKASYSNRIEDSDIFSRGFSNDLPKMCV